MAYRQKNTKMKKKERTKERTAYLKKYIKSDKEIA